MSMITGIAILTERPAAGQKQPGLSLRQLANKFDQSNKAAGLSDRTRQSYNHGLDMYFRYLADGNGSDDLSSFTIDKIKEYIV